MSHKTHLFAEVSNVLELPVGKTGSRGPCGCVFNFQSFLLLF